MKKLQLLALSACTILASFLNAQTDQKSQYVHSGQFLLPSAGIAGKVIGGHNSINVAPCVNEGFESTAPGAYTASNAVTGWTLNTKLMNGCATETTTWNAGASEFSIIATPISGFPGVGTLPHSPLGGAVVARLNDYINNAMMTKLATSFPVTASNSLFQFAWAAYLQSGVNCCDDAGFFTRMKDCNGSTIACGTMSFAPGCSSTTATFSGQAGGYYSSWQIKSIDLTPYIGTCVTFECWCTDNSFGGSWGCAAIDTRCGSALAAGLSGTPPFSVNYCPGSNAIISAPPGYSSYTWTSASSLTAISSAQASLAIITITNPVVGGAYYLSASSPEIPGCTNTFSYVLNTTQVSIAGTGVGPSCATGSLGTGTVQASGSSVGYNYSWTNSSNSVVSTSSVVSGLSAGIYTITLSAPGNTACGTAVGTVTVPVGPIPPHYATAPYCGTTTAYLYAPTGSNFQWYTGTVPVSSGTTSSYVVSSPTNNSIYRVGYLSQGCRDSTVYTLTQLTTGALSPTISGNTCYGTIGASVVVSYTPVSTNSTTNTYSLFSTGTSTPAYSASLSSTALTFTALNLTSGATYSLVTFDGLCTATIAVIVSPITPTFNVNVLPTGNNIYCSGGNYNLGLSVPGSNSMYTYSWSPATFLTAGNQTMPSVSITPITTPGNQTTIIYTVVVTPTLANCPQTGTYALTVVNPVAPTIPAIPPMCINAANYNINPNPAGGVFFPGLYSSGFISPSLSGLGAHSFTYTAGTGSCVSSTSANFTVYALPTLTVSGNVTVCAGSATTLTALGADTYFWSGSSQTNSDVVVNPLQNTVYTVTGTSQISNCKSSKTLTVITLSVPTLTISGDFTICAGENTSISVSGANTYSWNTGSTTASLTLSPSSSSVYIVSGTNTANNCAGTQSVSVQVNKCTELPEIETVEQAPVIYPNPFHQTLTIETHVALKILLYNNLGQVVFSTALKNNTTTLDLSGLSDGIYYLRTFTEKETMVLKVVKEN